MQLIYNKDAEPVKGAEAWFLFSLGHSNQHVWNLCKIYTLSFV